MSHAMLENAVREEMIVPCSSPLDAIAVLRQVAHDVRQPLSAIDSIAYYLDLILPRDDVRVREQIGKLRVLVEESNRIVSDAVHFVQSSPLSRELMDLSEAIASAALAIGVQVDVRETTKIALGRLDPQQSSHLFETLLGFLWRISNRQRIEVMIDTQGPVVAAELGVPVMGYTSDQLAPLFDPSAGHGLSLASARRIVEAHGGTLSVSAAPDSGVIVRVAFRG